MSSVISTITPSISNSFKDIRKKVAGAGDGKLDDDDLLKTRAAASSWRHHRGPGSDRKPLREHLCKISSAKDANNNSNNKGLYKPKPSPLQSNKSSLLDSYEIEMISRQLNRLIESSDKNYNNLIMCRSDKARGHPDYLKSDDTMNDSNQKKKSSIIGGIWRPIRYPMICATLQDVVKPTYNHRTVSGKLGSSSRYQTRTRTSSMHSTNPV